MSRLATAIVTAALLASATPLLAPPLASAGGGAPVFAIHRGPAALDGAGEPTIGVNWETGAVMFQDFADTWRVTFDDAGGATWTNVRPPNSVINLDPILFTDPATGRTFAGGLDGTCSILSFSDNDGASWTPMGNSCAATFDHETIGSGPWAGAKPITASYDRAVYYCAQLSAVQCSLSQDGGFTFGPGFSVRCASNTPGLHGSVHVGPNGHAWLPFKSDSRKVCVAHSPDNGVTWIGHTLGASPPAGFDADVATTTGGWVYVGHQGPDGSARVSLSKDNGATWTLSPDLGASFGITTTGFMEMVAGDDERAAFAFLGTTTPAPGQTAYECGFNGTWDLYVAFTFNAGASWSTQKLTSDPVQRGGLWAFGGGAPCRNLLDFMDAQIDAQGNVIIGFADGCVDACAAPEGTKEQSTRDWGTIARQIGGRSLFAIHDSAEGAQPPAAPALVATGDLSQVHLAWTTPDDGGSAITGYEIHRDGALHASLGVVRTLVDTSVENGRTYAYQVRAINAAGPGALSAPSLATPRADNAAPLACFTHTQDEFTTTVDASCSSDDGSIRNYAWSWGDGSAPGSGPTASHTYSPGGTFAITLTVTDDHGVSASVTHTITATDANGDPDPAAPTLQNGETRSATHGAARTWQYYKVHVPAGASRLNVVLDGPTCSFVCDPNLDLYVRPAQRPTTTEYACRPGSSNSDETCTINAPAEGWWYIGVHVSSGGAGRAYTIRATA